MKILFYHPGILGRRISGSGIRPQKILKAFLHSNAEILEIHGDLKARKEKISQIKLQIKNGLKVDLVYFENLSTPLTVQWKKIANRNFPIPVITDLIFLIFCKRKNIKIAYFYRDIHWIFDEIYEGVISKKRIMVLKFFGYIELLFLKYFVENIYVPSENFADFLKKEFRINALALPPGSDYELTSFNINENLPLRFLYVGGTGNLYNPKVLFDTFNSLSPSCATLNYCTREAEWNSFKSKLPNPNSNTIHIHHASGEKLKELYNISDIAVYSLPPIKYIQLTIAFKASEYIAAGKPIIAYEGAGIEKIIKDNDIGWIIPYDENEFKKLIVRLSQNKDEIAYKRENLLKIREQFSWDVVIKKIIKDNF